MEFTTTLNRHKTSSSSKVHNGTLELTFPSDLDAMIETFKADTAQYMQWPIEPHLLSPELRSEVDNMKKQLIENLGPILIENNLSLDLNQAQESEDGSLFLIEHALYILAQASDCALLYYASGVLTSLRDICLVELGILEAKYISSLFLAYKEQCVFYTIALMEPKYIQGKVNLKSTIEGGRASPYAPWFESHIRPLIKQHLKSKHKKTIPSLLEEIQVVLREQTDCRPAQYENLSRKTVSRWITEEKKGHK